VHVGDDRVTIESVARALRRDLGQTLNENLSLFAALDLPFPHSVDLRDLGPDHRELSVLVPWPRGERCLTYAHLRREIGVEDGWRVTEGTGTRWGESVPLAHYVALARAVVATVEGRHVSLGAFAVAGGDRESTALVVTVPEGSLWHTTMGTIHVLVSDGTSPRFVERVSLTEFDIDHLRFVDGVRTSRQVLRARASDGRALEVEVIPNPCRTKNEPNPLVRLGATQAVLLGGSALGDRAGPY
jgi:hypothetical protein